MGIFEVNQRGGARPSIGLAPPLHRLDTYARITSTAQRQAAQTMGSVLAGTIQGSFSLGMRMQFDPVCFVGSLPSKPRMGHGLGQAETDSSKKPRTG